jgi:hypothetical protein
VAYLRAAAALLPHWAAAPCAGDGAAAFAAAHVPSGGDGAPRPLLAASVPPALLHRMTWLRAALESARDDAAADAVDASAGAAVSSWEVASPGAAACLAALTGVLECATGREWAAAAGAAPPSVARTMRAARFAF